MSHKYKVNDKVKDRIDGKIYTVKDCLPFNPTITNYPLYLLEELDSKKNEWICESYIEDFTEEDSKKIEEKFDSYFESCYSKRTYGCECGAWATEFNSVHYSWCPRFIKR